MLQDLTDDKWTLVQVMAPKWTLVQVMAWCRQAPNHYLDQCWPRSPTPYGNTKPQWVKQMTSLLAAAVFLCVGLVILNTMKPLLKYL